MIRSMYNITSRPTSGKALSVDQLRSAAPSIFAEAARPGVSSRYTFVSTGDVLNLFQAEGWEPVKACEQRVRLGDRRGFQAHEIRFARNTDLAAFHVGEVRAELILTNAHDGTRAYRIDGGLYRKVCSNGLVVANSSFAHLSIRHVDLSPESFLEASAQVLANVPRLLDTVSQWKAHRLTTAARGEFARRAALLRWDADQPISKLLTSEKLLKSKRMADESEDLWTTFNVVQEHLIGGGDRYMGYTPNMGIRRGTTRALTGLYESQKVNKQLWSLAAEFGPN